LKNSVPADWVMAARHAARPARDESEVAGEERLLIGRDSLWLQGSRLFRSSWM
jgi:hypothetical protein